LCLSELQWVLATAEVMLLHFPLIIISLLSAPQQFEMEGGNNIRCGRMYLGDCAIASSDQIAKLKF
jgi:hypothetical protein